ncbi:MAG: GTPase HflX [Chloroflexaceae bacterium]|nr:GTPase HflX [Chloroflexaceae bacterium]NJO06903.1 GTPase HflX [Chloroflexaceae bacterium]
MHMTEAPRKRAFLVGAELSSMPEQWPAEDSLRELALLADTAGLDVVGSMYQKLSHPFSKYFIGPGKLRELSEVCAAERVDLVIFDDELTPAQTRNLERELNMGVLDRTALILDIFAQHARTHEGRIQVELAQYEYLLPRLRRQWTHLERQAGSGGTSAGGAVGLRGPGETQLELDRRAINQRIALLKDQLGDVHRHRELYRKRRRSSGVPIAALVGYTNAGKSTLLNALSGANVLVEDRLFATLDPTTRQIALPGGQSILLTDTVGFIQKLPTQLIAAFRATLEEISEADILLHVLDITHPNAQEQAQAVEATLRELGVGKKPMLTVLNKVDTMEGIGAADVEGMAADLGLPSDYIAVSAQRGWGIPALLTRLEEALASTMVRLDALIPYQRNDLVSLWHERGFVEHQAFEAEGTHLTGSVPRALSHQFEAFVNGDGKGNYAYSNG